MLQTVIPSDSRISYFGSQIVERIYSLERDCKLSATLELPIRPDEEDTRFNLDRDHWKICEAVSRNIPAGSSGLWAGEILVLSYQGVAQARKMIRRDNIDDGIPFAISILKGKFQVFLTNEISFCKKDKTKTKFSKEELLCVIRKNL